MAEPRTRTPNKHLPFRAPHPQSAKSVSNADTIAPGRHQHPDATSVFKDSYLVDFLDLPEVHSESDLQRALVANLKRFLIELGRDFAFVGEQYLLQVGGTDFRLDLLFYHRSLQCLVAFDLKITRFEPEHIGKMEFYLE